MLLEPLGSGRDGEALLACNTGGHICVLKRCFDKENVSKEVEIWKAIIKQSGRDEHFTVFPRGSSHFVMPFLKTCSDAPTVINLNFALSKTLDDLMLMRVSCRETMRK